MFSVPDLIGSFYCLQAKSPCKNNNYLLFTKDVGSGGTWEWSPANSEQWLKKFFRGLGFLDWGFYTESGNWFIVSCCWHAAEADARFGPHSWESLTNGFLAEEALKTSGLALSLGSRQRGDIGYSRLLPFSSTEWEIYFSQARDCSCSQAGASCSFSLCHSSKSSCVGNCFAIPAWQQVLHGWRLPGERQHLLGVCSGHGRTGNRCGL